MLSSRTLSRSTVQASRTPQLCSTRNLSTKSRSSARAVPHPYAQRRQRHFVRSVAAIAFLGATGTALQWLHSQNHSHLDAEEPLRALSALPQALASSSQHAQIVKSSETPGVYLWGSNKDGVAAPDAPREKYIRTPRRLPFFDGHVLRDIKLDRAFAAAIDEKGDLLQWGSAYAPNTKEPTYTLQGKNLVSCALSRDRIIALSAAGDVYSIPVSAAEQQKGPKHSGAKSSGWTWWFGGAGGKEDISYRLRTPSSLGLTEKVIQIASGQEHALLLTSSGRVFSLASGTEAFPQRGQLGIPGLTWETRPAGAFDQPHELTSLSGAGVKIAKIAAGDFHSVVLDKKGGVYTFGDNSAGQLGFEYAPETASVDVPTLLPIDELYSEGKRVGGKTARPKMIKPGRPSPVPATVTDIFAGGNTSFLIVSPSASPSASPSPTTSQDTFAFGFGQTGQLGTGRWRHTQDAPTRVPALSSLSEYDEKTRAVAPIKIAYISVGATHAAAVLDTREGGDVLVWGNNEFYQLGTGRRSNAAAPVYIQPLDRSVDGVEDLKTREAAAVVPGLGTGIDQVRSETQYQRFQIAPKTRAKVGAKVLDVEQRVECGRGVSAAYSAPA